MIVLYHILLTLYLLWMVWELRRMPAGDYVSTASILMVGLMIASGVGVVFCSTGPFSIIQLLAWTSFLYFPLSLVVFAVWCRRRKRTVSYVCIATALAVMTIAVDAFLIEPYWLQVAHHTIASAKLDGPIRIAVIADIQTDMPGDYETQVLHQVKQAEPNLILFAGDYIQTHTAQEYAVQIKNLNSILRTAQLSASLGMYAVEGNVDRPKEWAHAFEGLPIEVIESTSNIDLGPIVLTGLSQSDSLNVSCTVDGQEKYHIVFGHHPDFSLGHIQADLLIAGHTHGGQVRLPFIGPLLHLSNVPRAWNAGLAEIAPKQFLYVSRGIGMERHDAPRLRFLCRPELAIIDLKPAAP